MPRPRALATLLTALSLLAAAAPSRADGPLRRRFPLIHALDTATITPPIAVPAALAQVEGCVVAHYPNAYSPLPDPLRRLEQRVTFTTYPEGRFDLHNAFMAPLPRAFAFDMVAPAEARLEFGYHLFRCSGAPAEVTLRVVVEDAVGRHEQRVALSGRFGPTDPRWERVSVDLPVAAFEPMRLTVAFEVEGAGSAPLIAWAEPAVTGKEPGPATDADTNVLWVIIDSARSDALGPRRQFAPATPSLDAIFAGGTSFTNAWSLSNQTRTSTAAMFASVPPSIGGFQSHDWALARRPLAAFYKGDPPFITALLDDAGWSVAHIGDNDFLWATRKSGGLDAGFPHVADYRVDTADADLASTAAVDFLGRHVDQRFFLVLGYLAPHTPYKPPPEWLAAAEALPGPAYLGQEQHLPRSYIGELMWVDANFERVLAALDELGLAQNTLVIITADHGEVMLRWHDCNSLRVKLRCGYNHSVTVYEDELNVPLAIRLPGRVGAGRVVDVPVSQADLAPTVMDLLGLDPSPRMVGRSLKRALTGGACEDTGGAYADGRLASAVRDGDWKLIVHSPDDDAATRARRTESAGNYALEELFDLAADPGETTNLAETHPEVLARMRQRMADTREAQARRFWPQPAPR